MNRVVAAAFYLALATVLVSGTAGAEKGGLRYTITVTQFENQAGWHGHFQLGQAWGTVLTGLLNSSGRFIVLGESDMRGAARKSRGPRLELRASALEVVDGNRIHIEVNVVGGRNGAKRKVITGQPRRRSDVGGYGRWSRAFGGPVDDPVELALVDAAKQTVEWMTGDLPPNVP